MHGATCPGPLTAAVTEKLFGQHVVRALDGMERIGRIVEGEVHRGPDDPAGRTLAFHHGPGLLEGIFA